MAEHYARVDGNTVVEVFNFKPVLHASLEVIQVPDEVQPNWLRQGNKFYPPPVVDVESPPVPPLITYKADIYRRCTDEEAEAIEMALASAPVRKRRMFEEAQYLDHSDEAFIFVREALLGMFTEKRADELLASS